MKERINSESKPRLGNRAIELLAGVSIATIAFISSPEEAYSGGGCYNENEVRIACQTPMVAEENKPDIKTVSAVSALVGSVTAFGTAVALQKISNRNINNA